MAVTPPTTGVNELMLEVRDLGEAESFYTGVLGFEVLDRWSIGGTPWVVWVLAGGTRIGLALPGLGIARARPGVHVHYAMYVEESDYDELVRGLRARGGTVDEVLFEADDGRRARSAYLSDPNDHVVEFWTWRAGEVAPFVPHAVTEDVYGLARNVSMESSTG
ncbi:VOC family protein [Amycolatopsis nigrescens]|uniref:VOC family protein n=1 Tax=Amycolatopsis nigrescens TaxID=381445 RepID=UPI00035D1BE5|nr:VOC family protein [Amycolatopsis nigrescens]